MNGFKAMFRQHQLVPVVDDGPVLCWRLERARDDHVEVTVTPDGITLKGDRVPNGLSAPHDLEWWISEATPEYLAGEFLTPQWTPAAALRCFKAMLAKLTAAKDDGQEDAAALVQQLKHAKKENPNLFDSPVGWQKALGEYISEMTEGEDHLLAEHEVYPESDFDPGEVALLAAIHDRFREAFREKYRLVAGKPVMRES